MKSVNYELDLCKAFQNISEIERKVQKEQRVMSDIFHTVISCKDSKDVTLEELRYLIDNSRRLVEDFLLNDTGSYIRTQMSKVTVDMNAGKRRRLL